jgi:hypothetical protein
MPEGTYEPVRCGVSRPRQVRPTRQIGGYLRCAQARANYTASGEGRLRRPGVCASMAYGVRRPVDDENTISAHRNRPGRLRVLLDQSLGWVSSTGGGQSQACCAVLAASRIIPAARCAHCVRRGLTEDGGVLVRGDGLVEPARLVQEQAEVAQCDASWRRSPAWRKIAGAHL